jgi:hypothetical protein
MFQRMEPAGVAETDLDAPVAYNLALWRLKKEDWNEQNLARLKTRRDAFVGSVQRIAGIRDQPEIRVLLDTMSGIELNDDPNRPPTKSPLMFGWQEEPMNDGLTVVASRKIGSREVKLVYHVVQSPEVAPFFLAERPVAVGEFVDLINAKTKEAQTVLAALPKWAQTGTSLDKPWNKPVAWRPRTSGTGIEVNPTWILLPDSQVRPLLNDPDQRAKSPALEKAVNETPTPRTPLQQIPPEAAKAFAEQLLGARLPRPDEWRAIIKLYGRPEGKFFRGPAFRDLWQFAANFNEGNTVLRWRPNEGIFLPSVQDGAVKRRFNDTGAIATEEDTGRVWLAPVDEGPKQNGFINLLGNVWIYLNDTSGTYVAGGSALSPPGIDIVEPQKVEAGGLVGATVVREGFTDVGIRPAFDAPPGFKERYQLFVLVRNQTYLTL